MGWLKNWKKLVKRLYTVLKAKQIWRSEGVPPYARLQYTEDITVPKLALIDLLLFMPAFPVEVRPARPACLQPRGAAEVEEWGEAAEESPVSQPGGKQVNALIVSAPVMV